MATVINVRGEGDRKKRRRTVKWDRQQQDAISEIGA